MCLTLARLTDMHIPTSYTPVQKSSGRFSALQVTKVLSTAELARRVTKTVSKGRLASLQHDMHELFSASDIKTIKTQNEVIYSGKLGRSKQPYMPEIEVLSNVTFNLYDNKTFSMLALAKPKCIH